MQAVAYVIGDGLVALPPTGDGPPGTSLRSIA